MRTDHVRGWAVALAATAALAAGGCGGSPEGDSSSKPGAAPVAEFVFSDVDACALSEPAERAAALGEAASETDQKNGALSRGCEATGVSTEAYLIYLITKTPVPAMEYFDDLRKDHPSPDVRDISGLGEKAFSWADKDSITVQAVAGGYVLGTSIVWFQDSDRPTDTGPTAERLKTLTEQVIGRLGK